jgi:hypothetical protein
MIRSARFSVFTIAVLVTGFGMEGRGVGAQPRHVVSSVAVRFSGNENNLNRPVDVPNVSLTISTTGRPVFVALVPESSNKNPNSEPYSIVTEGTTKAHPFANWTITIIRDSTFAVVATGDSMAMSHNDPATMELPLSINCIDSPEPGQHVYTVRVQVVQGDFAIKGARLVAYEL